jgi:hypothetical protein
VAKAARATNFDDGESVIRRSTHDGKRTVRGMNLRYRGEWMVAMMPPHTKNKDA